MSSSPLLVTSESRRAEFFPARLKRSNRRGLFCLERFRSVHLLARELVVLQLLGSETECFEVFLRNERAAAENHGIGNRFEQLCALPEFRELAGAMNDTRRAYESIGFHFGFSF